MFRHGTLLRAGIGATVVIVAVFLGTPTAQASPEQDYTYYAALNNSGFVMWNPAEMRRQGLAVCVDLASKPWRIVMTEIMTIGYDMTSAADILSAAIVAYCPQSTPTDQLEHAA